MLPKIENWIARESVEFARVWRLSVEFKFLLHLFPSSLLGFWPLSVEFERCVTLLSVEFFCVTCFSVEFKKCVTCFSVEFFCVTCFSVEFFVRYMFFCGVQKMRYMFFCRVFFALHVFLWSFFALHVFLSSFEFSSKIFYKLLNYSVASKIFCTSKLFHFFQLLL